MNWKEINGLAIFLPQADMLAEHLDFRRLQNKMMQEYIVVQLF